MFHIADFFSLYVHTSFNVFKICKGGGCFSLRQANQCQFKTTLICLRKQLNKIFFAVRKKAIPPLWFGILVACVY